MKKDEEILLAKRAASGNTEAFETIVRENEKTVYNLSLKILGNLQDAEDATQETFIRVYTSIASYKGESKLSVWIYRICNNVCIDIIRKRRPDTESLSVVNEDGEETEREIADESRSPETLYDREELRHTVNKALIDLPDHYRQPIILRDICGLNYEEIAEALNIELATVKTRIFRGRKKLAEVLSRDGNFLGKVSSIKGKGGEQA